MTLLGLGVGWAQAQIAVTPSSVTPSTLVPEKRANGFRVEIPEAGALQAPAGAENLTVILSKVTLDGGFPEVESLTKPILDKLARQRTTLARIYAAASEIEAVHARAGFVLARISVPPQNLADGGSLRLVLTDGFIESIDVAGLPVPVQAAVKRRTQSLLGRKHITLEQIETALMLASDVPGLTLRSTLMRGQQPGGSRIVLQGAHDEFSGSSAIANNLPKALGETGLNLQVALNSPWHKGEQIYGFVAASSQLDHFLDKDPMQRVLGAGLIFPLSDDGKLSLNPEVTAARTTPRATIGVTPTTGVLGRQSLRLNQTIERTRLRQSMVGLTLERVDEQNQSLDMGALISHDRYWVLRMGGSISESPLAGANWSTTAQVSRGLAWPGAIRAADVTGPVGLSRQGADAVFNKLLLSARASWALSNGRVLALNARAQSSFKDPMLRSEQLSLEGADGLSSFVGSQLLVDQGMVIRGELSSALVPFLGQSTNLVSPYVFAAFGRGSRVQPTTGVEDKEVDARSVGLGLRGGLNLPVSYAIEYSMGSSSSAMIGRKNRLGVNVNVRF